MKLEGFLSFIIRGESLDFDGISTQLNLQPTKIKRKGEFITLTQTMIDDYWAYKVRFGKDQLRTAMDSLLNDLIPKHEYIRTLAKKYNSYIFFSLRSNLGQMGFELSPTVLKALAELNIRFEVHILSYGEVESDN